MEEKTFSDPKEFAEEVVNSFKADIKEFTIVLTYNPWKGSFAFDFEFKTLKDHLFNNDIKISLKRKIKFSKRFPFFLCTDNINMKCDDVDKLKIAFIELIQLKNKYSK
jgi:hypothetical protein